MPLPITTLSPLAKAPTFASLLTPKITLPLITLKPASLPLAIGAKAPAAPAPVPTAFQVVQNTQAAAISSIQSIGQQYLVQTYNADGNLVTKAVGGAQIAQSNFTQETASSFTAAQQASEARLVASLKLSPADVAKVWQDSVKIDYLLCIKSQQSLPVEFNLLQTPALTADFTYNFYDSDEKNLVTQEDQSSDPLANNLPVPRFIQLNWDTVNTSVFSDDFASRTQSETQMASTYFNAVRGVATLANAPVVNSFQKNLAQVQPIYKNGQALSLVDTHDLPTAFNSTSNARLFKNTATTTVNTNAIGLNTINFNDIVLDEI